MQCVCVWFVWCVCVSESLGNNCLLSPLPCNLKVKGEWVSVLALPSLVAPPSLGNHMHPLLHIGSFSMSSAMCIYSQTG